MLSRVAEAIYWMSRYLERAENLARALDVSRELALLPQGRDLKEDIAIPLALTGTRAAFLAVHRDITPAGLWQTLGFSLDEPASIACCLKRARENAHAVRGSITADTWETLNTTWLELRARLAAPDIDAALRAFVEQHGHDLPRRSVAEQLAQRLFMKSDAMGVHQFAHFNGEVAR